MMKEAASQRVLEESIAEVDKPRTAEPTERTEENQTTKNSESSVPTITQDEEEETQQPTNHRPRTRATRSLTDEFIYNMMELPGLTKISPRSTAARKFPLQFLCDFANAVIDGETGEIMEYRHLMKNPKHRERWQRSFSKEIRRLATTTEIIKLVMLKKIPKDRLKDETYARICCNERPEKTDPDRTRITMGGD
jgi:hypothetical protein